MGRTRMKAKAKLFIGDTEVGSCSILDEQLEDRC